MKTRHVVAIGILTAIAVGLLAIGIKITGQKPKVQTNAYYQIDNYNYTNNTWTISGQPQNYNVTHYENNGVPAITKINYQITYNQNHTLDVKINITGLKYIDSESTYQEINYTTQANVITNEYNNITQLQLIQTMVKFEWDSTTTDIITVFALRITTTDTTMNQQIAGRYIYNGTIFADDVIGNYYTYDTINIQQDIRLLYTTYQTGYTTGYQTKNDLSDGNFFTIQETMLNVLTMPFTFITQGFNVTLWEGTPYQINIGNFIKSLIAIATILFIIKMFTSGFSVIGNYTSGTGANISQWRKNRSERKLNESKARLNDRTNPNHKTRDSHVTIKKE